ncbi:MAG: hypothetical protein EPN98_07400 [Phenylobacterium sp.]|nr:MAG: hypothetical protein EPN98_07400 [Phenylobacterium sp.]
MPAGKTIMLRLRISDPVPGVAYSLQDKKSRPVDAMIAGDGPVTFDVPARVADGPRFLGEFVRSEGPERRFVYIAIGGQAGQAGMHWSRRVKVDIHLLPTELIAAALAGKVLEANLPGRDKDGGPACATLQPIGGWRAVGG